MIDASATTGPGTASGAASGTASPASGSVPPTAGVASAVPPTPASMNVGTAGVMPQTADPVPPPRTGGYPASTDPHGKNPAQIEREIAATRGQMDSTLDALKAKLQPRNLIDELLDGFRGSGSDAASTIGDSMATTGRQVARTIKENPVPSLLAGAAALWWMFDDESKDREQPHGYRTVESDPRWWQADHSATMVGPTWRQEAVSYVPTYDWSPERSGEDRDAWTQRAGETLERLKASVADTSQSAADRVREVSRSLVSVSGHDREAIHDRWANLREHSGSFVDARTGEPYDESYGAEWKRLASMDHLANVRFEEDPTLAEKAESVLDSVKATLDDAETTVEQKVKAAIAVLGGLYDSTGEKAADYSRQTADYSRSVSASLRDAAGRGYRATADAGSATAGAVADAGRSPAGAIGAAGSWTADAVGSAGRTTADAARSAGQSAYDAAITAGASVAEASQAAADAARDYSARTGQAIADGASYLGNEVSHAARRTSQRTGEAYRDYPLAFGGAAVGLGLLAGLLIPRTRYEDEAFGEEADRIKRTAARTAEVAVAQGQQVAERTVAATVSEIEKEGLAPGQLAEQAHQFAEQARGRSENLAERVKATGEQVLDKAKTIGQEVLEQGKQMAAETAQTAIDEAKKEGLAPSQIAAEAKSAASATESHAEQANPAEAVHGVAEKVESIAETAAETAKKEAAKAAKRVKDEATENA